MSRKAAVALASVVVLGLLVSLLAVTFRLDVLRVEAVKRASNPRDRDPIVREVTETVKVHKEDEAPKQEPAPVVTVVETQTAPVPKQEGEDKPPPPDGDGGGDKDGGGDEKEHDDDKAAGDKFG